MSVENKLICLSLNSAWQPIGNKTVKEAICDLTGGDYLALDIHYDRLGDSWDFSAACSINPVRWDEWMTLPIRDFDLEIHSPKLTVRVPTVILAKNYSKMPIKRLRISASNIRLRDKNVCQYTGKKLTNGQGNIDHVIPRSKGGEDSWENLVFCDKSINRMKGSKLPKEIGLTLLKKPTEPLPVPAFQLIREALHQDWIHFLIK